MSKSSKSKAKAFPPEPTSILKAVRGEVDHSSVRGEAPERGELTITVPPLPELEMGDRVALEIFCFGKKRQAVGVVEPILTSAPDGGEQVFELAGVSGVAFEVRLPPIGEIHPIYHDVYPRGGVYQGRMQLPTSHLTPIDERQSLLRKMDAIGRTGAIAPKGAWVEQYSVIKTLANGKRKKFDYWRVRADNPIFEHNGKKVKSLHLGAYNSPGYQDWSARIRRRNEIIKLEEKITRIEKQTQDSN